MKLLSRDQNAFLFLIGKRERQMMLGVLKHYPMLSSTYSDPRHSNPQTVQENQELLREALAEQQKENRRLIQEFLSSEGRFREHELGFQFALKPGELEWLLQVFNDVRVGSWVQLGSPAPGDGLKLALDEKKVRLCCIMEIAGLFEGELLEAIHSSD